MLIYFHDQQLDVNHSHLFHDQVIKQSNKEAQMRGLWLLASVRRDIELRTKDTRPCLLSVVLCTQKCPCAWVWKLDLAATQNRRIIPLPSLLCLSPLPRLMDALNSSKRMLRRPITISDQQWPDQWPHTVSDTCSTCHESSPLPPWTQALAPSRSLLAGRHSKDECPKLIHSDLLINLR